MNSRGENASIVRYIQYVSGGRVNGYGVIEGLTDGQYHLLLGIARAVDHKTKQQMCEAYGEVSDRELLMKWTVDVTHGGRARSVFDRYAEKVLASSTALLSA